jgi:hypothetical protein
MKEALKQIVGLLEPVAALADGTPFEHSEVIQRCVDATEIALDALAQPTSGDYALGYAEGFNDACKPKPAQEPVAWMADSETCVKPDERMNETYYYIPLYTQAPTAPAQPTFVKHEVESAEDWSEWVCPDPDEYLIKCCDCGLVHEAQFRVAEYKPTPSEEFVVTNNPDMQTQFRMKRHSAPGAQPKEPS